MNTKIEDLNRTTPNFYVNHTTDKRLDNSELIVGLYTEQEFLQSIRELFFQIRQQKPFS